MTSALLIFAAALSVLTSCASSSHADAPAATDTTATPPTAADVAAPTPLVVVELFTSEGCSSCPPADALLRTLATRPDVVALSFHVDYWDRLGWRDPFSSAAFTARQQAYARSLDGRVYTPEMVVGGTVGFVGSRRGEAQTQIAAALERPAPSRIALTAAPGAGRTVRVTYAATGAPEPSVVHLALVQSEATTEVRRGENGGRTLRHANVVRAFETHAEASGEASLPLPDGLDAGDVQVVAYVQRGQTGAISGAATAAVE